MKFNKSNFKAEMASNLYPFIDCDSEDTYFLAVSPDVVIQLDKNTTDSQIHSANSIFDQLRREKAL